MIRVWLYVRRFEILLASLLLFLLFGPPAETQFPQINVPLLLAGAILLAAAASARGTRRHMPVSLTLIGASFVLTVFGSGSVRLAGIALEIAFLAYTSYGILRYVLGVPAVTRNVMVGAICVYLLMGLTFARTFFLVQEAAGRSVLVLSTDPAAECRMPEFIYFSFTTLTTVGYGDIHPLTPFTRSLAATEAVLAQIYLVVLIGRLVGLNIVHRQAAG